MSHSSSFPSTEPVLHTTGLELTAAQQPFSLQQSLEACEGSAEAGLSEDEPLRIMVPTGGDGPYNVVPYDGQEYLAISYCWPGEGFTRLSTSNEPTQVLDGETVIASKHFSKFMRTAVETHTASLRKLGLTVPSGVWLDCHCINQSSPTEKAAQVAIMRHIYSKAQSTLIMLEDIAMSRDDFVLLQKNKPTDAHLALIRRVVAARWFTRAWCSQESVLSTKAIVCVHQVNRPEEPMLFTADLIWQWLDAARGMDSSLPTFSQSKGMVSDSTWFRFGTNTSSWAMGIVDGLGCCNQYDKVVLVLNLLRRVYRIRHLPDASNIDNATIRTNVLKMVNVLAIQNRDFSLLLVQHRSGNPLQSELGFGWAGAPIAHDKISEVWNVKDYDVAKDTETSVDERGLTIKGHLAKVVRQHIWKTWRDDAGFHVSVDGEQRDPQANWLSPHLFLVDNRLRLLRDLLYALEAFEQGTSGGDVYARSVYGYLLDQDYHDQPAPFEGDLKADMQSTFAGISPIHRDIANGLDFIRRGDESSLFSTVLLDDGCVLLVSGNTEELHGASLFQPHVIRPKIFSRPMILTANSLVLNEPTDGSQVFRCRGGVRGWGLISDTSPDVVIRVV